MGAQAMATNVNRHSGPSLSAKLLLVGWNPSFSPPYFVARRAISTASVAPVDPISGMVSFGSLRPAASICCLLNQSVNSPVVDDIQNIIMLAMPQISEEMRPLYFKISSSRRCAWQKDSQVGQHPTCLETDG
jgi:hypothetical protein